MRLVGLALEPPQEIERPALTQGIVDRKPRFPRLGAALGGVEDFGLLSQPIEIIPLGLEETDRRGVLALQFNPVDIIELPREQIVEIPVDVPMLQLRAIEQHDRGRDIIVALVMARTRHRHDRFTGHVALKQIGDIAHAKAIGVGHHRLAAPAHHLGRGEAKRGEALQIVGVPRADVAAAKDRLAQLHQSRIFGGVDDPDIKTVGPRAGLLVA